MINADLVRDKLSVHIDDDRINLGNGLDVSVDAFVSLFSGADWTKESMLAHVGETGYGPHIERWANEGLFN